MIWVLLLKACQGGEGGSIYHACNMGTKQNTGARHKLWFLTVLQLHAKTFAAFDNLVREHDRAMHDGFFVCVCLQYLAGLARRTRELQRFAGNVNNRASHVGLRGQQLHLVTFVFDNHTRNVRTKRNTRARRCHTPFVACQLHTLC